MVELFGTNVLVSEAKRETMKIVLPDNFGKKAPPEMIDFVVVAAGPKVKSVRVGDKIILSGRVMPDVVNVDLGGGYANYFLVAEGNIAGIMK